MSNAFMGQRQQASPMGFGGYSGGYDPFGGGGYGGGMGLRQDYGGGMGGYGGGMGGYNPFGGGGYGTQFGGYDMGGGGGFGGYQQPSLMPAYQPTINDAFSNYFSQQYYGGPAFNPFAATSMFGGGGYGGGFGGGGRGGRGGRRGSARQNPRQMFEDYFQPEQPPQMQPQPMDDRERLPPPSEYPINRMREVPIGVGAYQPGGGGQRVEMGPVPQPYMGTDVDSIMPVQMQDTPVQSAPMFYEPPQMQPYAPSPFASPFSRPGRDMFTNFRMR